MIGFVNIVIENNFLERNKKSEKIESRRKVKDGVVLQSQPKGNLFQAR